MSDIKHPFCQDSQPREEGKCDFTFPDGDYCGRPKEEHKGQKCIECRELAVYDTGGHGRYRRYKDEPAIEIPPDVIVPVCLECGEFNISDSKAKELDEALEPIYKAFHPDPLPVRPCAACGADCAWCVGANQARKNFPRAKVPPVHDADQDNPSEHHCSKCFTELEDVASPFDKEQGSKWG